MIEQQKPDIKIIERIAKLLALGSKDSGATEAEANLAMEKAHSLMSEHNLSMATIGASGGDKGEQRTKDALDGQAMFDYQRKLMRIIADSNYCYVSILYSYKRRGRRAVGYQIIGSESNVVVTKVMFEYLANTIDRLVREFNNGDYRLRMSRSSISWCAGCAERLGERINERHEAYIAEQKKKAEQDRKAAQHPASPSHGALVVVMEDYAQNEAWLNEDFRLGKKPGTTKDEHLAREAREKARHAEALALGHSREVADWYSIGYSLERSIALAEPKPEKPLTEKEKEKQRKENERFWQRQQRRYDKEMEKRDWHAYNKGSKAGDSISLDRQIDKTSATKVIK